MGGGGKGQVGGGGVEGVDLVGAGSKGGVEGVKLGAGEERLGEAWNWAMVSQMASEQASLQIS